MALMLALENRKKRRPRKPPDSALVQKVRWLERDYPWMAEFAEEVIDRMLENREGERDRR